MIASLFGLSFGKDKKGENQNFAVEFSLGPAFGFGDVFKEYSYSMPPYVSVSAQNKLGIHFGFGAKYYLKENLAIQGALDFQNASTDLELSYLGFKSSESEGWHINKFFLNVVYDLSPFGKAQLSPYVFAGLGLGNLGGDAFEESETKFGFNVGAGLRYNLMEDLSMIGYLVFTDIFTEENATTYLGFHLGVEYRFSLSLK